MQLKAGWQLKQAAELKWSAAYMSLVYWSSIIVTCLAIVFLYDFIFNKKKKKGVPAQKALFYRKKKLLFFQVSFSKLFSSSRKYCVFFVDGGVLRSSTMKKKKKLRFFQLGCSFKKT